MRGVLARPLLSLLLLALCAQSATEESGGAEALVTEGGLFEDEPALAGVGNETAAAQQHSKAEEEVPRGIDGETLQDEDYLQAYLDALDGESDEVRAAENRSASGAQWCDQAAPPCTLAVTVPADAPNASSLAGVYVPRGCESARPGYVRTRGSPTALRYSALWGDWAFTSNSSAAEETLGYGGGDEEESEEAVLLPHQLTTDSWNVRSGDTFAQAPQLRVTCAAEECLKGQTKEDCGGPDCPPCHGEEVVIEEALKPAPSPPSPPPPASPAQPAVPAVAAAVSQEAQEGAPFGPAALAAHGAWREAHKHSTPAGAAHPPPLAYPPPLAPARRPDVDAASGRLVAAGRVADALARGALLLAGFATVVGGPVFVWLRRTRALPPILVGVGISGARPARRSAGGGLV